jgi:hypothetical protein
VTTVVAPGYDMAKLRKWTEQHAGLTLGLGITGGTGTVLLPTLWHGKASYIICIIICIIRFGSVFKTLIYPAKLRTDVERC